LLSTALHLRGVPYRLGGEDPKTGFDCSGYVQYVFRQFHVELPRTVAEQFHVGSAATLKTIRAGDLLFFTTVAPGPSHVAIALSADAFIHAPSGSGMVRTDQLNAGYWRSRFVGARHVL
jgi:cell wall-associated NlpC family hydrolase